MNGVQRERPVTGPACSSGAFAERTLDEAVALVAAAGFDGIELDEGHARELAAREPARLHDDAPAVVGVGFGATDCGDLDAVLAQRRLATALDAPLATLRAAAPGDLDGDGRRAAGEAARDALFAANLAGEGPIALELPAAGSLIPDADAYAAFWPLTVGGRAPLAVDTGNATAAGVNPNQLWRTLASRIALVRVDGAMIGTPELAPWLRMAKAYAYPGPWVLRPAEPDPSAAELADLRATLADQLARGGRA